jgi:hypothetical protein
MHFFTTKIFFVLHFFCLQSHPKNNSIVERKSMTSLNQNIIVENNMNCKDSVHFWTVIGNGFLHHNVCSLLSPPNLVFGVHSEGFFSEICSSESKSIHHVYLLVKSENIWSYSCMFLICFDSAAWVYFILQFFIWFPKISIVTCIRTVLHQ